MQLNCYFRHFSWVRGWNQNWMKVMQLTAVILLAGSLTLSAAGVSQSISFSGKDVPFEKVLAVIKKQTGYVALTSADLLASARPVTIKAKNMPLSRRSSRSRASKPSSSILA